MTISRDAPTPGPASFWSRLAAVFDSMASTGGWSEIDDLRCRVERLEKRLGVALEDDFENPDHSRQPSTVDC